MSRFERQWPKAREATPEEAEVLTFWQVLTDEANAEVRQCLSAQDDVAKGSVEEAALYAQMEALHAVVDDLCEVDELLQEFLIGWSDTDLAMCGVIMTLDHQGASTCGVTSCARRTARPTCRA